jgi:hypothetical protein
MSLSQNDRPTNPALRFLKVKSGAVSYWDKESQENVNVPTPLEFIVLDQLATIKGWSDQDESNFWSNEVRSVGRDILTVRTKNGTKEQGIWKEIKDEPSLTGTKYNSSVYIATKGREGLEINNLSLTGAALKAWIKFTNENRINTNKVILTSWSDAKKGSVSYKVPVFEAVPIGGAEKEEAIELDIQLQIYLNEYFSHTPDEGHDEISAKSVQKDTVIEDIDDEQIDLSSIPF